MSTILGTHNSLTSYKLVWWQRPFSWFINLCSRCQSKSIDEQLKDGVSYFNLQICYYKDEWYGSHGLAIYNVKFWDIFEKIKLSSSKERPIYFQLYLDKNFFVGQNIEKFNQLIKIIERECLDCNVHIAITWVENNCDFDVRKQFKVKDNYWGLWWIKDSKNHKWYEKLPIPYLHAKKYNKEYKELLKSNEYDVVLLDFYHL